MLKLLDCQGRLKRPIKDRIHGTLRHRITAVKDGVAKTSKQVNQTIKDHVTFGGTGEYVKAFRLSRTIETPYQRSYTWYVAAPYYRLTYLLENGHAMPWGGRSRAFPHIKYGEELAKANMLEIAKEAAQSEY